MAGTVRNNFVLEQVMTMSKHVSSGQVRSGQDSDKSRRSCQVSTGQVRSGQVSSRSGKVR